jgi:hypothetical protein
VDVLPFLSLAPEKLKEVKTMNAKNIGQNPKEEEIFALAKKLAENEKKNIEKDKLLDEILNDPTILKELHELNKKNS